MSPVPAADDAYDRGHEAGAAAGAVLERLKQHDDHFKALNGSLDKIGREMHDLTMAVQRLGDQATARDTTLRTTTATLQKAENMRREQSWSPLARLFVAVGIAAAVAAVVGLYLSID